MGDFFSFKKLITPIAIQVIFIIALLFVVIGALANMANGEVLAGILTLLIGPFAARIYCEMLIVMFKIHEGIQQVASNTAPQAPPAATQPAAPVQPGQPIQPTPPSFQ